jgi:glycerol-3-phosphate acyltransferase PlsY
MALLLVLFGFFLGSIPTGVILAKVFSGIDPRQVGSGNIGATNVLRAAGKKVAVATLLGDILKGVIPVLIAEAVLDSYFWIGAVALAAFLGHIFSVFLKFKGGKGAATALGVFLALSPLSAGLAFAVCAATVAKWRYISLGSLVATAAFPGFLLLFDPHRVIVPFALIIAALIFWRHRENIKRLLAGTESKFGKKAEKNTES